MKVFVKSFVYYYVVESSSAWGWLLYVHHSPEQSHLQSGAVAILEADQVFLSAMRRKVADGNSHSDFCIELIDICTAGGISYFLENPDTSWLWQLKSYKAYRDAGSPDIFRLCFCSRGERPLASPRRPG